MIIGLTGANGSGKGTVADFLKSKGFYYYSLSDVIRDEIRSRNQEITRELLVDTGNELRSKHGAGYLAEKILERLEKDRNQVVDSFRNPSEVKVFRNGGNFYFVGVEADTEVRFNRLRERGRESDPMEYEEFLALEQREAANPSWQGQQLAACLKMADFTLVNNGSISDLHQKASSLLQQLKQHLERPGWDEYFMNIARVASARSNCVKRKVAAIIVRDRRVISTGYNGTPRGTRNCYEGGCPRCNSFADSGTRLDECLCSHGEENAITQAAYHGVSVKDATLYTTFAPCLMCTKMIINAGIREVVYNLNYPLNETSFKLLQEAGVACRQHKVE
ncbi:MAG: deaminase [Acidobacteriota bacterium]